LFIYQFFIPQSEPKAIQASVPKNGQKYKFDESPKVNQKSLKFSPYTEPNGYKKTRSRLDLAESPAAKTIKSFSVNDVQTLQKREEMLKAVKEQCDLELEQFLEILSSQLPTQSQSHSERAEQYAETLQKIRHYADRMQNMTIDEIVNGKCKELVNQVQQLQQTSFTKKWMWRENVTKLLLIISRVSRLVEHLELTPGVESPSKAAKTDPEMKSRSKSKTFSTVEMSRKDDGLVEPQLSSAPASKEKEGFLTSLISKVKRLATPSKEKEKKQEKTQNGTSPKGEKRLSISAFFENDGKRSANSSPNSSLSSSMVAIASNIKENIAVTIVNKQSSLARVRSETDLPLELLCRICEELVPSELLEAHSRICAIETRNDIKAASCDEKITKYIKTLERKEIEIKEKPSSKLQQFI